MGIADRFLFLGQSRRRWHDTGAVAPSGRLLARAITGEFRRGPRPARVLEVGPGTGVFTGRLIRALGPEDRLELVESNPRFAALLRLRMRKNPRWRQVRDQVGLTVGYAPEAVPPGPYDYIVSGLPMNNFEPQQVERLLGGLLGALDDGGVLSYFEYLAIRRVKSLLSPRPERHRLRGVARVVRRFIGRHQFRADYVLMNLPPACARHLRKEPVTHGA